MLFTLEWLYQLSAMPNIHNARKKIYNYNRQQFIEFKLKYI